MIKPRKLAPGDTVAALSLSWGGAHTFPHRYQIGKQQLEAAFGVQVVEGRYTMRSAEWLARNPQARAEDLMEAFANPAIAGIISVIGGDDSLRILPYLDLAVIRANPKIFMGYSDTTISHFACHKAGLVSFYGPAIMAGFGENGGMLPYAEASVRRALCSSTPIGRIEPNQQGWTVEHLDWGIPELQQQRRLLQPTTGWCWLQGQGRVTGRLIGGCIEVLDWLRGTSYWPEPSAWQGAILFLETSEEAPSAEAVARILRSFAAVGMLHQVGAVLCGRLGGQRKPEEYAQHDQVVLRVISTEYGLTNLPVVTNMDFGHTDPIMVLPYGIQAELDCDQQIFTITEHAVVD